MTPTPRALALTLCGLTSFLAAPALGAPPAPNAHHADSFDRFLARADARVSPEARAAAAEHTRRERWVAWPEVVDGALRYSVEATLSVPAEVCQVAAASAAAHLGATLLDHDVKRPVAVYLKCQGVSARASWSPPGSGGAAKLSAALTDPRLGRIEGAFDYTPRPAPGGTNLKGLDFELDFLARTPFQESPKRTLDYAEALNEPWFAQHARNNQALSCWPALWGTFDRQCVLTLPELQPRQCAALALHHGYRDLLEGVNGGLSPRHTFELMAWCGQARAHLRFTRGMRAEVAWFRPNRAESELETTIVRRQPVPLRSGSTAREAFDTAVRARDQGAADGLAEALARTERVAPWLGAAAPADLRGLVERLGKSMRCTPHEGPAALTPFHCEAPADPAFAAGNLCRVAAFAAAVALPRLAGGPLAKRSSYDLSLPCDQKGRVLHVTREYDHVSLREVRPDDSPSDLRMSGSDHVETWSLSIEALRELR